MNSRKNATNDALPAGTPGQAYSRRSLTFRSGFLTLPVPGKGGPDKDCALLSVDDRTDAAINYAKGVGEGLINQQVNDRLNQFGNAKVSLGTGGQFSGYILLTFHNTDTGLLFTQLGVRRSAIRLTSVLVIIPYIPD